MNVRNKVQHFFRNGFNFISSHRLKTISVNNQGYGQRMLISEQRFDDYKATLQKFGFEDPQVLHILKEEPNIFSMKREELSAAFMNWYCFKIKERDLLKAITSCPRLLLIDSESLKSRMKELMTVFTQKDILNLLKKCPEVYFNDFDTTVEKVSYFVNCMGVEQPNIIKSGALHSDMNHIQLRHNFLVYTGIFKKPKSKFKFKNAPLNQILHEDLDVYLKLSGLTLEEYNVFVSMFDELFEDQNDEESDSDSDVDD